MVGIELEPPVSAYGIVIVRMLPAPLPIETADLHRDRPAPVTSVAIHRP